MVQQAHYDDPVRSGIVSYQGVTTSDGAVGGTTLVCSDLASKPDFDGLSVVITSGDYKGQVRDINGSTTGGTVTVNTAFGGQIVSGTSFILTAILTTPAEVAALQADVGDASASTLGSLYAILGNPAQDFLTMVGYEGTTSLAAKLTAARAGYLDNINNAELLNVPDLSTLTATRIGYLDFLNSDSKYLISTALSGTELANSIGRLIYELGVNRLTETRAGYLDEAISAAKTLTAATITSIRQSVCAATDPASSIGKLLYDNLNAPVGSIPTNPTLQTVWTDARAGYLDFLNSDSKYLISNALPGTEVADSIADKIKSIKAETDKIPGGEYTGTASAGTAVETTIKEIVTTKRTEIKSIWLDLVNLTANATIKVYHKIDGVNYRQYDTYSWTTSDEDGVLITGCTINNDWKISIVGGEGAAVNIPYNIIYEVMES